MPSRERFIELQVRTARGELRFVRPLGPTILLGGHSPEALATGEPAFGDHEIALTWQETGAFRVSSANGTVGNPLRRLWAGEQLSCGSASVSWRWLPEEEYPTITGPRPSLPAPAAVTHLAQDLTGDRYQRGNEVGRGGIGQVLEALEKPLHRAVALKVLLDRGDDDAQERFIREARITGRLEHPSIVPIHELNVDSAGHLFYTMKLVRGVTLLQILRDLAARVPDTLTQYPLQSLLTIFQKVCDAVAFAHAQPEPIIHRDLKPENIMVGDYGEVLVMDWGAAKILSAHGAEEECFSPNESKSERPSELEIPDVLLTQAGSVMGTPGYMAPEQARGQAAAADERTDIYALGAILYALLTLEAPARLSEQEAHAFGANAEPDAGQSFRQLVAPLLQNRAGLPGRAAPDSLGAVVHQAMALQPADRYPSVPALQADVAAYQAGFATSAEDARPWKKIKLLVRRNKTLFSALAAIFVILAAATAISLQQRHVAVASNRALETALHGASLADFESARQRFENGAWREGVAFLGRALTFWPENRGAANYLLSALAFGRSDRAPLPIFGVHHGGPVGGAVFSPDGRYFATGSYDHTTCIRDAATGAQVGKILQHDGGCGMPSFSPDGRQLLTTGADGVAKLWDARSGEPLIKPMRHSRPDLDSLSDVLSAVFSPDGKRILTASLDHTARIWDAATGEEIAQLVNPHRVADAIYSPDGSRILTSYWYGGAILWDATTFQPIGAPMTHGATVRKSVFTPDGNKIVTSSLDKTTRIWDGHTAKPLSPPLPQPDLVWNVAMSPDGTSFATACYDKTVRLFSTADGRPVGTPMEHEGPVDTVVFSSDGKRLLSANRDKTARVWNVKTCRAIGTPMQHDEAVLDAIFSPDDSKVLSIGWDNVAYLWQAEPPPSPGEIIQVPGKVRTIAFDQNEDRVFVATTDGRAALWSLQEAKFVSPVVQQQSEISFAAFDSAAQQFATAGSDEVIHFWNANNGAQIGQTKPIEDPIVGLAFSTEGHSLFAAYLAGSVLKWKIPEGTLIGQPMKHSEKMDALAVSPLGQEIATGCRDDYLDFWEAAGANTLRRRIRHNNPVIALSYSPDGKFIATGCEDHAARIWSIESGEQSGPAFPIKGRPTAVRYTAGGSALLIGSNEDGEVNYYDVAERNTRTLPLPHEMGIRQLAANASGSLVITVTNDGIARLWRIPTTSEPPPKWLPEYLRAIGGLAFSDRQELTQVTTRERIELRKKLLGMPAENSIWDKLMRDGFAQKRSPE